ncbi:hypothetical protein [Streptomyces sp. 2A115]|uniref:hypothetical protein n=1 Tax=Streptomyces sp. 2A115 TaxID=3457439 RepID=UPI003FD408FE
MQINYSVLMISVFVIALAVTTLARGRWRGPVWLVAVGAAFAHPLAVVLMDRAEDAPDGWLRWAFQVGCGMLAATLVSPVYHWLRSRRAASDSADAVRPVVPPAEPPQAAS